MKFLIMRKDDIITIADIESDGRITKYDKNIRNEEFAPLHQKISSNWLIKWWEDRSVPIKQGNIEQMLRKKGLLGSGEYLLQNLGLSLTDYYWIKPINSNLKWKDVNLFNNNFKDNLLDEELVEMKKPDTPSFTPNSSLQGQLEKTWMIDENNERILIKGNRNHYSSESINEVIASTVHELQGYDNYTKYNLLNIKNKAYDYGCYSKAFTSERLELVSAYAVITSEKQSNDISTYEHFINVCGKHGIDVKQLRRDLEYQIMTDFILSNRDRHLSNVSILRDADTLQFLRLAPIYDSGKSLFVGKEVPNTDKDLLKLEVNSFASSEIKLLSYVTNTNLVDINKLPTPEYIKDIYLKDSQIDEKRVELVVEGYKRKIDLFSCFQSGKDLRQFIFS